MGAGLLGPLADKIGRRRIFKYDLVLFAVFSVACIFPWSVWPLVVFRFVLGVAIGLDYPIAASYLAEVLPAKVRGRWLVGAFSSRAVHRRDRQGRRHLDEREDQGVRHVQAELGGRGRSCAARTVTCGSPSTTRTRSAS